MRVHRARRSRGVSSRANQVGHLGCIWAVAAARGRVIAGQRRRVHRPGSARFAQASRQCAGNGRLVRQLIVGRKTHRGTAIHPECDGTAAILPFLVPCTKLTFRNGPSGASRRLTGVVAVLCAGVFARRYRQCPPGVARDPQGSQCWPNCSAAASRGGSAAGLLFGSGAKGEGTVMRRGVVRGTSAANVSIDRVQIFAARAGGKRQAIAVFQHRSRHFATSSASGPRRPSSKGWAHARTSSGLAPARGRGPSLTRPGSRRRAIGIRAAGPHQVEDHFHQSVSPDGASGATGFAGQQLIGGTTAVACSSVAPVVAIRMSTLWLRGRVGHVDLHKEAVKLRPLAGIVPSAPGAASASQARGNGRPRGRRAGLQSLTSRSCISLEQS